MIKILKDFSLNNINKKTMDTNGEKLKPISTKMIVDNFIKFKLLKNSKFPSDEWAKRNKPKWNKNKHKQGNWGLITGKINNIIGFDPDYYKWKEDHPFYTDFLKGRTWEQYIKEVNTFTTKTPNGGLHFIFNYNKLGQINCPLHEIDIKSDGGYLVGPGSKVINNKKEMAEYIIINPAPVQDMPEDLYNWLYNNLNYKHNKKNTIKITKEQKEQVLKNPDKIGYYNYDFTDAEIIYLLDHIPKTYILNHADWLKTATAMKSINKIDLFLEYCLNHKDTKCKKKGDEYYNKNIELINGIREHNNLNMINHLLLISSIKGARTWLDYVKYKPIHTGKYKVKPDLIEAEKLGYKIKLERGINYVIKSDTGTGKTTIAKNYLLKHNLKLISIVSRISLGDAQYTAFNEAGLKVSNYRLVEDRAIENGENIIITIDSIKRLNRLDYSNYVVFLDEYNSLIEYLITCPNLKDKRVICFKILIDILKTCKQIIAVDADIHPATLKLLDYINKPYKFINNKYQHNKKHNVKSSEIFNYDQFINQLLTEEKALVCCDSKGDSEVIFNDYIKEQEKLEAVRISEEKGEVEHSLNNWQKYIVILKYKDGTIKKCALITSDTDEIVDLDDYDFVVFSPKIIYGLDSQVNRPVYCHYKEHTISPKAMLQQLCRCRNITYLKYIFYKKEFKTEKYQTLKDVKLETKQLEEISIFELMCSKEEAELYNSMFNIITYNEDAYSTNKFGHYKDGLRSKGFTDKTDYYQTNKKKITEKGKENKQEKYDNFSSENPIYKKINEYLDLPEELWADNKELFIEQADLNKHFNIQTYFFKGEESWQESLKTQEEFNPQKVRSTKNKYIFIKKFLEKLNIKSKTDFNIKQGFNKQDADDMFKNYKLIFRDRGSKKLDLTIPYECEKLITRIYKKIFGADMVQSDRVNIGGKKIMKYTFNYDTIYKHRDISKYKYTDLKDGKLDFTFNKENNLYNVLELDNNCFIDDLD